MDSYSADAKEFDDESSEEEYDVDGIVPDTSYNNNNNNSPMLHNNSYHPGKRDKSSSSSRENYKRNKTHAAMVHHDDRTQQRTKTRSKPSLPQQQQRQQQPYYHDERSNRRKKKAVTSSKKKHYEASFDEEQGLFSSPVYRDELDSSFPPPRLSDFDEMFQRAASNRQQRRKHDPEEHLELDQALGKPGEQYYLDLAGNIRKVNSLSVQGPNVHSVVTDFAKQFF